MTYNEPMLSIYEDMVVERHKIWAARSLNKPMPWTTNPVLSKLKMTNMFRVVDPGSQFVFQIDSENPLDCIARLVFYRITNQPTTWYAIRSAFGDYPGAADFVYNAGPLFQMLDEYRRAGNTVFSGAYIIMPEPGTTNNKIGGVLRLVRRFVTEYAENFFVAETQVEKYRALFACPGLGKFLAMQILTDWNYLQHEEPDLSFVVAGPGARRGAAILNPHVPAEVVIRDMTEKWSQDTEVLLNGRSLTTMDVQNTMCEWSKYAREINAPRKKSDYRPAHPGVQPQVIVPQWW